MDDREGSGIEEFPGIRQQDKKPVISDFSRRLQGVLLVDPIYLQYYSEVVKLYFDQNFGIAKLNYPSLAIANLEVDNI